MTDESSMSLRWLILGCLCLAAPDAVAQCAAGPDAPSERALQSAIEAQSAIAEHLDVAAVDRSSRGLSDAMRDRERSVGAATAQATINFGGSSVRGFSVCDEVDWEPATLEGQTMGAAVGVGARDVARVEARVYAVSDSVVQTDLNAYRPEREAGAMTVVPGATGAGHGLWSVRVELLDSLALTVGRVNSHTLEHSVGWGEETDEDGNTSSTLR